MSSFKPGLDSGRRFDVRDGRDRPMCGRIDAGGDDDRPSATRDDRAALEQHAGPICSLTATGIHLLIDRQRLAGEQRFVDLEVFGDQQSRIGGNHFRGGQVDDVAGPQRLRRHDGRAGGVLRGLTGVLWWPPPGRRHGAPVGPARRRARRPPPRRATVAPTGDRVDRHDAGDQQRVDVAADDRRGGRPHRQDRGQRIGQLDPGGRRQPRQVVAGPRSGASAGL